MSRAVLQCHLFLRFSKFFSCFYRNSIECSPWDIHRFSGLIRHGTCVNAEWMCIENRSRQSVSAETLGVEVSPTTIPRNIRKALRNTEHREETLVQSIERPAARI